LTAAAKPDAAIIGIGETPLGRIPDKSAMQLMAEAAQQAADDAGISLADIDGVITGPIRVEAWTNPAASIAVSLGIEPSYLLTLNLAGATGAAMIQHAAMAVATGQATTVLCIAGQNLLSALSRGGAVQGMAEGGAAHLQFEAPYGPLVPTLYAVVAQRHMHEFGTTEEQMADVAVGIRHFASLNGNAYMQDPLTRDEVMAARMITSPLKKFDCSVVCDGAGAAIVTTPERALDLAGKPVPLLGSGYGLRHSFIGEAMEITSSGAVESGRDAFAQAGLGPDDIDVAELYDCFTITVIVELEDLGFCPKGEGGRFVEDGHIGPGGKLPVTTHGGLLSAGHFGPGSGFLHVLEGVRQMRGDAGARQVAGAETALVHGNGGVIATHCTLILGGEAAL
jgi:acetyl-CoA acetyltransferase